jgi:hypothetical protein
MDGSLKLPHLFPHPSHYVIHGGQHNFWNGIFYKNFPLIKLISSGHLSVSWPLIGSNFNTLCNINKKRFLRLVWWQIFGFQEVALSCLVEGISCSERWHFLGYRSGGPGSIPGTTRKEKVVGLEWGPLSLVSTTEELLDRKVVAPV